MTLSRFFWSNSRGPGGLTDSREKGLGFPNRYQYVPPTQITNHAKKTKSHMVETHKQLLLLACWRPQWVVFFNSSSLVRLLLFTSSAKGQEIQAMKIKRWKKRFSWNDESQRASRLQPIAGHSLYEKQTMGTFLGLQGFPLSMTLNKTKCVFYHAVKALLSILTLVFFLYVVMFIQSFPRVNRKLDMMIWHIHQCSYLIRQLRLRLYCGQGALDFKHAASAEGKHRLNYFRFSKDTVGVLGEALGHRFFRFVSNKQRH